MSSFQVAVSKFGGQARKKYKSHVALCSLPERWQGGNISVNALKKPFWNNICTRKMQTYRLQWRKNWRIIKLWLLMWNRGHYRSAAVWLLHSKNSGIFAYRRVIQMQNMATIHESLWSEFVYFLQVCKIISFKSSSVQFFYCSGACLFLDLTGFM